MNPRPTTPLYGLVLAGGRSRRMGVDKAALVHPDGRPLACRGVSLLSVDCSHAFVSLRHDQELPPMISESAHVRVIRDPEGPSHGPLGGMVAAMRAAPVADWLVIACDLPRLDVATLGHLVSSRLPDELFLCYRSEFDGLPEPLCGYYAARSLAILEQALADGIHCPRKILIQNHCRLLDPITPHALDNANTPADWEAVTMTKSVTYHIHYFGLLEDRRGLREESVVSTADTPLALFTEINARHPFGMQTGDFRAVVNDVFVSWDHPLAPGDQVAFLPPMSGG